MRGTPTQECHGLRPLHRLREPTSSERPGPRIQGWLLKATAGGPRLAGRGGRRGGAGSDWDLILCCWTHTGNTGLKPGGKIVQRLST